MNAPLSGSDKKNVLQNLATLRASATSVPSMQVYVSSGGFWHHFSNGPKYVDFPGGLSQIVHAPVTHNKWVIIAMSYQDGLVLLDGAEAVNPIFPLQSRSDS